MSLVRSIEELEDGVPSALSRFGNPLTTNNNSLIYSLFALRLKAGEQEAIMRIIDMTILCTSNATYNYFILKNPNVVGTPFSWLSYGLTKKFEYDNLRNNNTTVNGGELILGGCNNEGNQAGSSFIHYVKKEFALFNGISSDELVFGVQRAAGGAETFYANVNLSEK